MRLTVALTGPTDDIGRAFLRALDHEPGTERVIGMARRPFDPQAAGFSSKIEYRQGDVLESDKLRVVFAGADVVGAAGSPFRAGWGSLGAAARSASGSRIGGQAIA